MFIIHVYTVPSPCQSQAVWSPVCSSAVLDPGLWVDRCGRQRGVRSSELP